MFFSGFMGKDSERGTNTRFTRFLCPAFRIIPNEPRKKDTHSFSKTCLLPNIFWRLRVEIERTDRGTVVLFRMQLRTVIGKKSGIRRVERRLFN